MNSTITVTVSPIRVDVPALEAYVAYLREQNEQQKQIDQLAVQVQNLTMVLQQSQAGLKTTVDSNKEN